MILTTDIANILYDILGELNVPIIEKKGNLSEDDGSVQSERIVILPKTLSPETYWEKCFVEVNVLVPDKKSGKADNLRLRELERSCKDMFKTAVVGEYDDTPYMYSLESIGIEEDKPLKCHFVNVRLLFENLNTV